MGGLPRLRSRWGKPEASVLEADTGVEDAPASRGRCPVPVVWGLLHQPDLIMTCGGSVRLLGRDLCGPVLTAAQRVVRGAG